MEVRARVFLVFLALSLGFSGLGQWVIWEEDFETQPLSNLENEVKRTIGWHIVDRAWFYSEPAQIQAFPSGSRALYFGRIEKGRGTYDQAQAMEYEKEISKSSARPSGSYTLDSNAWMRVSFKYVREVEHFEGGTYDETRAALVQTPSAHWVFNKSSKDKSNKEWTAFVSEPILLSSYDTNAAVKFAFNPKDKAHNDYFGWLIDNVKVEAVVVITTSSLPEGHVGQTYSHTLKAEGGVRKNAQYKWKVEGLPEGLQLRDGEIKGILMKAGVYQVKVTVTDYASEASAGRFPDSSSTRIYTLVIQPTKEAGSHAQFAEDFESGAGPEIPGWTRTGLWHRTNAQTVSIKGWVAYFGRNEEKIPNYETKEGRAYGELTSPKWNVADRRGQQVYISFEHIREVEKTGQIGYDKTYVEIRFDDGPWAIVWYMDAKEPQTSGTVRISTYEGKSRYGEPGDPILVPDKALTMQIRFVFDSVDGLYNNYLGWAIDNVQVELKAGELTIVTTALPEGEVGVYYEAWLEARGGTPPYMWTPEARLPNGLILDRSGKLYGVPEQTWSSTIVVKVTDKDNNAQTASLPLKIGRKTLLFHDDFSADKWSYEGLWHRIDQIKDIDLTKHGYVAYYGKDELKSPNYATGARTVGYLTSPRFPIGNGVSPAFKVTFKYWREVEFYAPGGYDKTYVEVRFLVGTSWSRWYCIWYKDSAHSSEKTWTLASVGPYTIPTGATEMQIRFVFDSVDRFHNNYVGWLIDNVQVASAAYGEPLPTSSLDILTKPRGDFAVFNVPNPVRDVHTTTFVVRGVEADLIKVEVYDLTGRLVYVGEAPGNELVWHTQDLLGRYLANGVYLYKVYVKVGDTWIVSDTQKIVILR